MGAGSTVLKKYADLGASLFSLNSQRFGFVVCLWFLFNKILNIYQLTGTYWYIIIWQRNSPTSNPSTKDSRYSAPFTTYQLSLSLPEQPANARKYLSTVLRLPQPHKRNGLPTSLHYNQTSFVCFLPTPGAVCGLQYACKINWFTARISNWALVAF